MTFARRKRVSRLCTWSPTELRLVFAPKLDDTFILDEYAKRSFRYFVEQTDPTTGMVLDRASADGA